MLLRFTPIVDSLNTVKSVMNHSGYHCDIDKENNCVTMYNDKSNALEGELQEIFNDFEIKGNFEIVEGELAQ